MLDPARLIEKAKTSKRHLRLLNFGLARMIPFNEPHGFKITEITDEGVTTILPYKKANFNHIKGLHACALATLSEFTTGLVLLNHLDAKKYRIIMQKMEMEYHYQGKMEVQSTFNITNDWIDKNIVQPLLTNPSVLVPCEIKTHDLENNHISTGKVFWQVKAWSKVKTKA